MKILSFLAQFTCNIPSSRCSPLFLSSLCKLRLQELFVSKNKISKKRVGNNRETMRVSLGWMYWINYWIVLKPLTCQLLMRTLHLAVVVQTPVICKFYSPTRLLQHQDEV